MVETSARVIMNGYSRIDNEYGIIASPRLNFLTIFSFPEIKYSRTKLISHISQEPHAYEFMEASPLFNSLINSFTYHNLTFAIMNLL